MIAKPTKKTLPIAIALILLLALLGWLFNDITPEHTKPPQQKQTSPENKTPDLRETSARFEMDHIPHDMCQGSAKRPSPHIDMPKRLEELYLKYPELKLPHRPKEKCLISMYEEIFSINLK